MTLKDACTNYLRHCQNAKKLSRFSTKAYHHDLKDFQTFLGSDRNIQRIDRDCLYKYVENTFCKGRSEATVKRRLACLKTLFKWLENEELIEQNPFSKFNLAVRIPKRLPRNLQPEELQATLEAARKFAGKYAAENQTLPNRRAINTINTLMLVELLFCTGVRIQELVSIELQDIHLPSNTIKIHGKGQRERKVFIPDREIRSLISTYIALRSEFATAHDHLLINSHGKPLSTQSARLLVKKNAQQAAISRPITPHMYRHSTATQLLKADVDIRFVQKLLGHENIETTQVYAHVEDSTLKDKVIRANIRRCIL